MVRSGRPRARARRAVDAGSERGHEFAQREWIAWEWQTLCRLHAVGASVPEPIARSPIAILMELIGDEGTGAPKLVHVELSLSQARAALDSLLRDVEDLLDLHLVHGDLSAYNVLWHDERARIIDVPQAIDLHGRPDGYAYFARDVANLERYFAKYGLRRATSRCAPGSATSAGSSGGEQVTSHGRATQVVGDGTIEETRLTGQEPRVYNGNATAPLVPSLSTRESCRSCGLSFNRTKRSPNREQRR